MTCQRRTGPPRRGTAKREKRKARCRRKKPQKVGDLSESLENYLEAVLEICAKSKVARVRDVAHAMNVRDASVTQAMKVLEEKKLIARTPNGFLDLTDDGLVYAQEVKTRHTILTQFLVEVFGIDPKQAEEDACRMEHAVSHETFDKFLMMTRFIRQCPQPQCEWLSRFQTFCEGGNRRLSMLSARRCGTIRLTRETSNHEGCDFTVRCGLPTAPTACSQCSAADSPRCLLRSAVISARMPLENTVLIPTISTRSA